MKIGKHDGASTKTGINFENETDLSYLPFNKSVFYPKHNFIKWVEAEVGCSIYDIWSRKLLPDDCLIFERDIFIFEKKTQQRPGSTDEKLQTCDFKKKQYEKIGRATNKKIHFCYILSDWFKRSEYFDVLKYIKDSGCDYFFNTVPVEYFYKNQ